MRPIVPAWLSRVLRNLSNSRMFCRINLYSDTNNPSCEQQTRIRAELPILKNFASSSLCSFKYLRPNGQVPSSWGFSNGSCSSLNRKSPTRPRIKAQPSPHMSGQCTAWLPSYTAQTFPPRRTGDVIRSRQAFPPHSEKCNLITINPTSSRWSLYRIHGQ